MPPEPAPLRSKPLLRPGVPRIRTIYQLRAETTIPSGAMCDETLPTVPAFSVALHSEAKV